MVYAMHPAGFWKNVIFLLTWPQVFSDTQILTHFIDYNGGGAGTNIILGRKITISPQPNIRLTWDQSVNSSLSVVVQ